MVLSMRRVDSLHPLSVQREIDLLRETAMAEEEYARVTQQYATMSTPASLEQMSQAMNKTGRQQFGVDPHELVVHFPRFVAS